MLPKRYISIDPGPASSAYCLWIDGLPAQFGEMENSLFMEWLRSEVIFTEHVACEMISTWVSSNIPQHFVHYTLIAIGRIMQVVLQYDIPVTLIHTELKQRAICGHIRGTTKPMMNRAMIQIYGDGSKSGKGTKKAPGLLYNMSGSHHQSALQVGHTFKTLYPLGDLDAETIVRYSEPVEDGIPIEGRKGAPRNLPAGATSTAPLIDFRELTDEVDGQEIEICDIGERLKAGKCANPACQGTIKPGSCKCPVLQRDEFRPDRGIAADLPTGEVSGL